MTKPVSDQAYPHAEIEQKWQSRWKEQGTYRFNPDSGKPIFYVLTMFSYPSGDKLHLGHWYNFAPADTFARFKRLQGYEVFEPMGFDAFGLPAENYAIKTGIHPAKSTKGNIEFMREQLNRIGAMYDWNYEVNTSSPEYYKWTQWWFLLMYKRGLAYQKEAPVNWCPDCQTVLANEQVKADATCERCGTEVIKKNLKQWFFRITDYSQRLLDGLDDINWPEKTKAMQRYWIGKSVGTEIHFPFPDSDEVIKVFTTRADTLFGVTYLVVAPEYPGIVGQSSSEQKSTVEEYIQNALRLSEADRMAEERLKTGVFTGLYVQHPFTKEKLPVWVADYVIGTYGTGAVMAVPAHDERDYAFARQYDLPIVQVINGEDKTVTVDELSGAFTDYGVMMQSGEFNDLTSKDGIERIGKRLEELKLGAPAVTWHLRDWAISRQRYWGAPIPIVYCPSCGTVPVPESDLPVRLPEDVTDFKPLGKSPLANVESFVNTTCPKCGGKARRDPDTMDTFVCSSWYFMRYPDARLETAPFDTDHLNHMLPIQQYIGGSEHATGHLLYARFFAKVAKDAGFLKVEEPITRLVHQGMILHHGERMSKSKGNVVAPEPILNRVGSDVLRCYLMFFGDYNQGGDWSETGITGVERFVARFWRLGCAICDGTDSDQNDIPREVERKLHQTIRDVTNDLENFAFNTAIAHMMELTNQVYNWVGSDLKNVNRNPATVSILETMIKLIAPFAPHLCEELWHSMGHEGTVFNESWPEFDEAKAIEETVTIAVQINGKLRATFQAQRDSDKDAVIDEAMKSEKVQAQLEGKKVLKTIVVPNKIVNIVAK